MKKLNRKFFPVYDTFPDRLDYVFPLAESCAATEPLIPINELWVFWRVQVETPNQDGLQDQRRISIHSLRACPDRYQSSWQ